jgi:hypothetical protein
MIKKNPLWFVFSVLLIATLGCSLPAFGLQSSTATPTTANIANPTSTCSPNDLGCILSAELTSTPNIINAVSTLKAGAGGGGGGSGGGGGGSGSSGGSGGSGGSGSAGGSNSGGSTSVPTLDVNLSTGPYVVSQIESLGGETISGEVCDIRAPFIVTSVTPRVTFDFKFSPQGVESGNLAYSYNIPKAGESHDATGSYTLSQAGTNGMLLLSLKVLDHVTFKGFDGKIPVIYKFNLVPDTSRPCPTPTP